MVSASALKPSTCLTVLLLGLLALAGWVIAVVFISLWEVQNHEPPVLPTNYVSNSWMGRFKNAAVSTDNGVCSEAGREILKSGGNAVDAALAVMICNGNKNPSSMGLGGGFFMVVHNITTGISTAINAREAAPAEATAEYFKKHPKEQQQGWKSVAVPGEVKGYWRAHQRFGHLPWKDLFKEGIRLAKEGQYISQTIAKYLRNKFVLKSLLNETTMSVYVDPATGLPYKEGQLMKNPQLAETLEKLANSADANYLFYQGEMAQQIVKEFQKEGGFLSLDDLKNYQVTEQDSWSVDLPNAGAVLKAVAPPSAGPLIGLYLQMLDVMNLPSNGYRRDFNTAVHMYHKALEGMKLLYGHWKYFADSNNTRVTTMLKKSKERSYAQDVVKRIQPRAMPLQYYDANVVEKGGDVGILDHGGTSHVNVVDKWGNAVAATSSVNWLFGSIRRSPSTGILWNNHMADFATANATEDINGIEAGKRPRSSMSPVIIIDKKTKAVRLALGAAGGSKIMWAVANAAGRVLYFNETIKQATDAPRFFNRLNDVHTELQDTMPQVFIKQLEELGHKFKGCSLNCGILQGIEVKDELVFAHTDADKPSYPAGY